MQGARAPKSLILALEKFCTSSLCLHWPIMKTNLSLTIVLGMLLLGSAVALQVGDRVCLQPGLHLRVSPCGNILATSSYGETGTVKAIHSQSCSFGTYTWIQMELKGVGMVWGAKETNLIGHCDLTPTQGGHSKVLNVSYVNQRFDTPDSFGGAWACGPTSAVMAMSYYGKIHAHPIQVSSPSKHISQFGWYVSNVYTSPTGVVFNRMQTDSNGKPAWGAYGWCTENGAAWAWRIQDYAKDHGLVADFYSTATFSLVKNAIDSGNLVLLSTMLTSAGHIIIVRGYTGTDSIIVNDPWGNANLQGYPANGDGVIYTWAFAKTKWCVVFRRPAYLGELDNLPFPAPREISVDAHHFDQ